MTAAECLRAARATGIDIVLDGDDLVLEASLPPPEAILDALSCNKAEIITLLRPGADGWSAEGWQVFFDERAGIVEFDGGVPRLEAEEQAFACCVVEWMNRNPATSSSDRCVSCDGSESANEPLLPFGADFHGHAWLHSRCWKVWYEARKEEATVALTAMGIEIPSKFPNDFGKNGST